MDLGKSREVDTAANCSRLVWVGAVLVTLAMTAAACAPSAPPESGAGGTGDPADHECAGWLGDPEPGTFKWLLADLNNQHCSAGRGRLLQDHPARAAALEANQAAGSTWPADPFRAPRRWADVRGTYELTTFTDREGNERSAALHGPPEATQGPLPGVLLLCHACGFDISTTPPYHTVEDLPAWYWAVEVLAEAGYMVMTAELFGNEATRAVDATDFLVATPEAPSPQGEINPWHDRLDPSRLGIVGHSGAALVATDVGNGDQRFDAVVGWDPAPVGGLDEVTPRVPTMFQVADYEFLAEWRWWWKPTPEPGSKYTFFDTFSDAGIDTMQIVPRASTHLDWTESGSIYGEQTATYYTLAWFDRYLMPSKADDALQRLTATGADVFDESSDQHSIGTGFYDASKAEQAEDPEAGNVPITIGGIPVRNLLSFQYDSRFFLDDGARRCGDMRAGCTTDVVG